MLGAVVEVAGGVWMWACPIQVWTWTREALLTAMEPKKWRQGVEGQRAEAGASGGVDEAAAEDASVEVAAERRGEDGVVFGGREFGMVSAASR